MPFDGSTGAHTPQQCIKYTDIHVISCNYYPKIDINPETTHSEWETHRSTYNHNQWQGRHAYLHEDKMARS